LQDHQKLEKMRLPAFVYFAMLKAKLHKAFDDQGQREERHNDWRHSAEVVNFPAHGLYPLFVLFELHHLPGRDV
jgi:hypothetical protein